MSHARKNGEEWTFALLLMWSRKLYVDEVKLPKANEEPGTCVLARLARLTPQLYKLFVLSATNHAVTKFCAGSGGLIII